MSKKLFGLIVLTFALAGAAFAQESMDEKSPTDADKVAAFDAGGVIKRGDAIGKADKADLKKVMADPAKFDGKTILVKGVIVRSCKMEGCWLELAPEKDSASIHVNMKGHAFFVPLDSVGLNARVEGTVVAKTLSKDHVDHLIEDGAKFDKRNADGSVTQLSFEANGVELTKGSK
jgi:Domain of unknown function (DUF4920)